MHKICGVKGLGDTGIGYIEDFLNLHVFGFKKEFTNKYCKKGNEQEDTSIDLIAEYYDIGFIAKNTERKFNEYCNGEADVVTKDVIHDVKNSWDVSTFPYWKKECKNAAYLWQAQTYLYLWDKSEYQLHYTLNDASEKMIDAAYWKKHKYELELESEEVQEDLYEEVRSKMIFSHLPLEKRIKTYFLKRDERMIKMIQDRVIMAREYINSLK